MNSLTHLLEMLEAVNIQYTNEHLCTLSGLSVFASKTLVDDGYQPFEKTRIHELGDTVPNTGSLYSVEGRDDLLRTRRDLFLHGPFLELRERDSKEAGSKL